MHLDYDFDIAVLGLVGVFLTALVGFVGSLWTRVNHLDNKIEKLRDENQRLSDKLHAAADLLDDVAEWIVDGRRGKLPPVPAALRDQIDMHGWERARHAIHPISEQANDDRPGQEGS